MRSQGCLFYYPTHPTCMSIVVIYNIHILTIAVAPGRAAIEVVNPSRRSFLELTHKFVGTPNGSVRAAVP